MSAVKTIGEFVELVRMMRQYQVLYFDERNPFALKQAKKYEAMVDNAIAERDKRNAGQQQPELQGCAPTQGAGNE